MDDDKDMEVSGVVESWECYVVMVNGSCAAVFRVKAGETSDGVRAKVMAHATPAIKAGKPIVVKRGTMILDPAPIMPEGM